jgi:hypothetical protein
MDISMVIQLSHIGVLVPVFSSPKALVGWTPWTAGFAVSEQYWFP